MNRDLFLAILAMDSYNRGYGSGLKDLGEEGQIGNAILLTAPSQAGWEDAGFYALAYNVSGLKDSDANPLFGTNGTAISYRSTNFDAGGSIFGFFNSPLWQDIRSGWSVGADLAGAQAGLSLDFYNAVKGDGADPRETDITVTGHSLGGGLAGLVANLYGRQATIFDHMTYGPISSTALSSNDNIGIERWAA